MVGVARLTADMTGAGGMVNVGVAGDGGNGLRLADATPIAANGTDAAVVFKAGKNFAGLVGKNVTLSIEVKSAVLYTVSFSEK